MVSSGAVKGRFSDVTDTVYCIKATKRVIGTVDDLPEEVFRSGRCQRMFKRFIGVCQSLIDMGRYRSARAMMEFLWRRTDGAGRDWITNPAAQDAMMDLLDLQINSLTEQIEG